MMNKRFYITTVILWAISTQLSSGMENQQEKISKRTYTTNEKVAIKVWDSKNKRLVETTKVVVTKTPHAMSLREARAYFDENKKKLRAETHALVKECCAFVTNNDITTPAQRDLYKMLLHPKSRFIHQAGSKSIFLERYLGGGRTNWYFSLSLQVMRDETAKQKRFCFPLALRCNQDKAQIRNTVSLAEIESFHANAGLAPILVLGKDVCICEELEKYGDAIRWVNSADERLLLQALAFVSLCFRDKLAQVTKQ